MTMGPYREPNLGNTALAARMVWQRALAFLRTYGFTMFAFGALIAACYWRITH